uniref:YjbQ family protein n=1 Tax=Magnetococcus massalia (strain MO-1) TaxID=451514 RepID=A0A1S7LNU6_MAGMO|nr:Conserved protein of unknown function [Candidatus Magnetococcus massalia]
MKRLSVQSRKAQEFIDVSHEVAAVVRESGIESGMCHLFVPHTTAGLTVNENCDPDVVRDMLVTLDRLVPVHGDYRHAEGNSHSHIKASMMGSHLAVPIDNGQLVLGTWQGIWFTEFDGPRSRGLVVQVMGGGPG